MLEVKNFIEGKTTPEEIKKWCIMGTKQITSMPATINTKLLEEIKKDYVKNKNFESKEELLKNRNLLNHVLWVRIPTFIAMEKNGIVTMWELNCYEEAVNKFNKFKIAFYKYGDKALNLVIGD